MGFFLSYDPLTAARQVKAAVLIVQGETDSQVPPPEANKLAAAIRSGGNRDVTVRMFPATNHLFLADSSGAELTRYPEALARALQKIASDPDPLEVANRATQHMYIVNPLRGMGGNDLFSTHPSTQARIQALMGLAGNYPQHQALNNPMGTQQFADMPDVADQTLHEPPPF